MIYIMTSRYSPVRTSSIAILALAILAPVSSFAGSNLTDLQSFRGRTAGAAKVVVGSSGYYGKAKIRVSVPDSTAAKIKITASIKAGSSVIPVNNEFTFSSSGVFRGKELAPGVTSGTPFKGHYTATTGHITFQGKFNVNSTKGTFSGTAIKLSTGKLKITYSIFVGDNTDASYVYTYTGK